MINYISLKNSLFALTGVVAGLTLPNATRAVSLTQEETSVVLGGAKQLVVGVTQNATSDGINIVDQSTVERSEKPLKQAKNIKRLDESAQTAPIINSRPDNSANVLEEPAVVQPQPAPSAPAPTKPTPAPSVPEQVPSAPAPTVPVQPAPVDPSDLYNYVYQGLLSRGWPQANAQMMVDVIIPLESGWNSQIINSSSGAFGLFQLLGHGEHLGMSVDQQMDIATAISAGGTNLGPWSF